MKNWDIGLPEGWKDSVDENIRCGLIEILILSMLSNKDMYTYEIKMALSKKSKGRFQLRDGSMYAPMYRMLDRKLISVRQVLVGERRFRNYYHIEESGKVYLEFSIQKFYENFGLTDTIISECNLKPNNISTEEDES